MGDEDVATPAMDPERGGDVLIAVWEALGMGDEDVATPAMDLERGGDVLIAVWGALGMSKNPVGCPRRTRRYRDRYRHRNRKRSGACGSNSYSNSYSIPIRIGLRLLGEGESCESRDFCRPSRGLFDRGTEPSAHALGYFLPALRACGAAAGSTIARTMAHEYDFQGKRRKTTSPEGSMSTRNNPCGGRIAAKCSLALLNVQHSRGQPAMPW